MIQPNIITDAEVEQQFVESIGDRYLDIRPGDMTENQWLMFVLVSNELSARAVESDSHDGPQTQSRLKALFDNLFSRLFMALVMVPLTCAAIGVVYLSCHWLLGDGTDWVLYFITGLLFFGARLVHNDESSANHHISLRYNDGLVSQLNLGRLSGSFSNSYESSMILFAAFGMQMGLIQFTSDNLGVEDLNGFWDAAAFTMDNWCRGLFLYVFDLYEIYVARPVSLSIFSATVFFVFRIAMTGLTILTIAHMVQYLKTLRLLLSLPTEEMTLQQLLNWFVEVRRRYMRWSRDVFDELIFLVVVEQYIRGQFDRVRQITRLYPRLDVNDDVRCLFVDNDGEIAFEGYPRPIEFTNDA